MLTIRNLQVEYKKQSLILKGITLSMESGKIHGIVGLNGAGKTTLLNTLYGFIRPVEGSILYNDNPLHRRDIAYLEAENYFYPYMTGHEYLDLFPAGENGFQVDNWQKLFNITLKEYEEELSLPVIFHTFLIKKTAGLFGKRSAAFLEKDSRNYSVLIVNCFPCFKRS